MACMTRTFGFSHLFSLEPETEKSDLWTWLIATIFYQTSLRGKSPNLLIGKAAELFLISSGQGSKVKAMESVWLHQVCFCSGFAGVRPSPNDADTQVRQYFHKLKNVSSFIFTLRNSKNEEWQMDTTELSFIRLEIFFFLMHEHPDLSGRSGERSSRLAK